MQNLCSERRLEVAHRARVVGPDQMSRLYPEEAVDSRGQWPTLKDRNERVLSAIIKDIAEENFDVDMQPAGQS